MVLLGHPLTTYPTISFSLALNWSVSCVSDSSGSLNKSAIFSHTTSAES